AKLVFWIAAYARSGSSTVLSLTTSTSLTAFALFEPCHSGDLLEPYLEAQGCGALLLQIASCNFTGIKKLWGWSNGHSSTNGAGSYSPSRAAHACASADLVAFKTIPRGPDPCRSSSPGASKREVRTRGAGPLEICGPGQRCGIR
ncbi:unnamed protein product, partial [Prorocentrum cordatum]